MLDDLFTSVRGPGLIGLLLAVLVLAFLCVIGVNAFNETPTLKAAVEKNKREIVSLKAALKESEDDLTDLESLQKLAKNLKEAEMKLQTQEGILGGKRREITALEEQREAQVLLIDELKLDWEDYKQSYRTAERARAKGEVVDLSESMGPLFKKVKITRVTPNEMGVMTKDGPKRILYGDLPLELQDRFQFDEEEARRYREERSRIANAPLPSRQDSIPKTKKELAKEKLQERINKKQVEVDKLEKLTAKYQRKAHRLEQEMQDTPYEGTRKRLQKEVSQAWARAKEYDREKKRAVDQLDQLKRALNRGNY